MSSHASPSGQPHYHVNGMTTAMAAATLRSPPREKPLPALPPARTPSQISHQRQHQLPYRPAALMHMRLSSAPPAVAGPSRLAMQGEPLRQSMPPAAFAAPPIQPTATLTPTAPESSRPRPVEPPAYDSLFDPTPTAPSAAPPARQCAPTQHTATTGALSPDTSRNVAPVRIPDSRAPLWRPPSAPPSNLSSSTSTPPMIGSRPIASSGTSRTATANDPARRRVISSYTPAPPPSSAQRHVRASSAAVPTPSPQQRRRVRFPSSSPSYDPATPSKTTTSGYTSSANDTPALGQCWGIKRDGARCTRTVKAAEEEGQVRSSPARRRGARHVSAPPSLGKNGRALAPATKGQPIYISSDEGSDSDDDSDDGSPNKGTTARSDKAASSPSAVPTYCHQHAREINKTPGLHVPVASSSLSATQEYLPFTQFIPPTLSAQTAARLRVAMSEPFAPTDLAERGYLYVYELVADIGTAGGEARRKNDAQTLVKVGRSSRPLARVAQWRRQCESRQAVLRLLSPQGPPALSDSTEGSAPPPSTAAGNLIIGASSTVTTGQRGSHRWEKLVHLELAEVAPRPSDSHQCRDCGKRHREIFVAPRGGGVHAVAEVVERWRRFVEVAVPPG
ncbi:hypothetical protein BDZ90DRAFT_262388 [Jaminaea rosea]|uniref:Bacteriophage T5 Orf172 DNA-binding domain-containing protein n=1 Tax=Jaminaea rosea TaxID=1569628 RepID=A0A316UN37_9BASI|nr:hypothetical protein BDZ90DRAFT_262388 [Jaminaea rosea]PWN25333.1 hypothetical protein BDZ90DRAFT_262388 [Jaminaea rosea]